MCQPLTGVHVGASCARLHWVWPTSDRMTFPLHQPFGIGLLPRSPPCLSRSLHEGPGSHSPFRSLLEFLFLLTLEIPLADPALAHPALCPALPSILLPYFQYYFLRNIPPDGFLPLSLMQITSKFFHLDLLVLTC